jgi:acyl-CoA reductase-like NAD-dependent aldehyde dehydrogenase
MGEVLSQIMDPDAVQVVQGAIPETTALLNQKFDHIFYTGNGTVGKIIMTSAAKNLTPVTLELGGKSPSYIHGDMDPLTVAKRILWCKHMNCGQICTANDYVLVKKSAAPALYEAFEKAYNFHFDNKPASEDLNYPRIINRHHYNRLTKVLDAQLASGKSKIVVGNERDEKDLLLSPTVIKNVDRNDPIMKDEIFGPLLPIIEVEDENEALEIMNSMERPLSMYVFTTNKKLAYDILDKTLSGSVMINDVLLHILRK